MTCMSWWPFLCFLHVTQSLDVLIDLMNIFSFRWWCWLHVRIFMFKILYMWWPIGVYPHLDYFMCWLWPRVPWELMIILSFWMLIEMLVLWDMFHPVKNNEDSIKISWNNNNLVTLETSLGAHDAGVCSIEVGSEQGETDPIWCCLIGGLYLDRIINLPK